MTDEILVASLNELFTMCFTIDRNLKVREPSERLQSKLPENWQSTPSLLSLFRLQRPGDLTRFSQIKDFHQTIFLLVSLDGCFALRGQLVRLPDSGFYRFVGAPWLAWLSEHERGDEFQMSDYPNIDSQLDQRFLVASQELMVKDLESLATELKTTKEIAEQANRDRADMFAVMSHEMRTPLNGVISALTLIQDPRHESDQQQLLATAQESASSLLNVINYALDFAKVDAGRMELESQVFDSTALMHTALEIIRANARAKGLDIDLDIAEDVPVYFNGDAQRIRQVLINLLGNAVKFTAEGSVRLAVEIIDQPLEPSSPEKIAVRYTISDTGQGIAESQLEQIFEAFWTDGQQASRESSTGLGLAICKQLVELMGGRIQVESEQGVGTSFQVDLPLEPSEQMPPGNREGRHEQLPESFEGRVLIVDDNQTNLLLAEMILKDLGVAVRSAVSGEEAIEIANSLPLDLILMDISMPGMDGVEATRRINAGHMRPPIVALTAHAQEDLVQEYLNSGFKGYLSKPLIRQELIKELMLWLPASRSDETFSESPSNDLVLNERSLNALVNQIGVDNFRVVFAQFKDECGKRLHELIAAWVRRDLEGLSLQAHTLSSSVASFGGEDLASRLRKIDRYAKENRVAGIVAYMKDIEECSLQFLDVLQGFNEELIKEDTVGL